MSYRCRLIELCMFCVVLCGMWMLAGCGANGKSSDDSTGNAQTTAQEQAAEKTDSQKTEGHGSEKADVSTETIKDDVTEAANTDDGNGNESSNIDDKNSDGSQNQTEKDDKTMIYVALGDSLTKGYGLADAEKNRFSAVAAQKLNAAGIKCTERNYGVNGLTSSELLDMINGGEIGMLDYADVITVDIGANDVLHAADDLIYTNLAGNVLSTDDYAAVCADEESSLAKCKENTEAIIKALREKNDHAQIILFTIYNPYKNVDLDLAVEGENLTLAGFTDDLVKRLNENINDIAEAQGCDVSDWYTAFEINPNNLVNAAYGEGVTTNFDIHPNKDGHAVMGEVCYQTIKNNS